MKNSDKWNHGGFRSGKATGKWLGTNRFFGNSPLFTGAALFCEQSVATKNNFTVTPATCVLNPVPMVSSWYIFRNGTFEDYFRDCTRRGRGQLVLPHDFQ